MLGNTLVSLAVAAENLALAGTNGHLQFLVESAALVDCPQGGELRTAMYQHWVGGTCKAAAVAEVVNGIEKVALAHAVIAQEAVDLGRHVEQGTLDVLEVGKCELA